MECNKEEAIRAKGIAETKMQVKEFMMARKFILKAQKLYSDLENISQMLVVCDVHCSAEIKLHGNEIDWYEVLQIEQNADDSTIKKQYRKFALLLHPDKNKFPGAEAAFKLIGEAQRVLLDRQKRSLLDMKRRSCLSKSASARVAQKASGNSNIGAQSNPGHSFANWTSQRQQPKQPAQSGIFNGFPTFWTICPHCSVKYQYYKEIKNRPLRCHTCAKPFIAYDCGHQGGSPAMNLKQPTFPQQNDVPNQVACNMEWKTDNSFSAQHSKKEVSQNTTKISEASSNKASGKRKRQHVSESSESSETECGSSAREDGMVVEDDNIQAGQSLGCNREHVRRSQRPKQQVSYNENLSDDEKRTKADKSGGLSCDAEEDDGDVLKKEEYKTGEQSGLASGMNVDLRETKLEEDVGPGEGLQNKIKESTNLNGTEKMEENSKKSSIAPIESSLDSSSKNVPELFEYPDPDFHDFEEDRKEDCFAVGQIWAIYDTQDAMPRFYALIRKVFSPGFKLRITWLEPDPDDECEIEWNDQGLPVACGKFKLGHSEYSEQLQMFSHLMDYEKGNQRNAYKVLPRKGETWALFKNWNIKWKSSTDTHQKYEYEFAEILSEYREDSGTSIAYLGKVKGFASLFCRMVKEGTSTFQIPPSELFRFAYRVPSFKLTGEERQGVTKGSFELDPASLPSGLEEIDVPEELKVEAGSIDPSALGSRSSDERKHEMGSEASTYVDRVKASHLEPSDDHPRNVGEDYSSPSRNLEDIDIPEAEFCNFETHKSIGNFQVGQIWSLYCEEDGMPKYYGQITKVVTEPSVKLQLRWLASLPTEIFKWHDEDMPTSCGRFKITTDKDTYESTGPFSHQMRAESTGKKNEYLIFPRKDEVWALFRNWTLEMKCSELEHCKYDMVHVLEENDLLLKVSLLERVNGFNSVFKAQVRDGSAITMDIHKGEQLRFSHRIPAFQLTVEIEDDLRGCWELDPAALPVYYFA